MSKGLDALEYIKYKLSELEFVLTHNRQEKAPYISEEKWNVIEKELNASEFLKKQFRLVVNQLQAKNERALGGWVWVKDIEDNDELNTWKEVLE